MRVSNIVHRKKTFRDEHGNLIGEGVQESYIVSHPRDYTVHPLREGERRNTSLFALSMNMALKELSDPDRRAYWNQRWHAQLTTPEPEAPIDRKTGKRHIYRRLDRYVQAVLRRNMKE